MGLVSMIELTFYIYMAYCLAVCAICAVFVIKKSKLSKLSDLNLNHAKIWFSGLFLYMFCEILFYAKIFITAYKDIPGFSLWEPNYERTINTYNLYDGQPFFRLFLCFALIFAIYAFIYIFEKKRVYLGFIAINLFMTSLIIILQPANFYIEHNDYWLDVIIYSAAKEAALIVIFINLLVSAFYISYKQEQD
jgi:hypothetical protein